MDIFDDRKLLDYETYEEYLDSFVQTDDIFYLRNRDFARINAALGYRLVYSYLLDKYTLMIMAMLLHNVIMLCTYFFYNARCQKRYKKSCKVA